jgi:hypothetical protein
MKRRSITRAYERFIRDMARVGHKRLCDCEVPGFNFFVGDAVHHLCSVLGDLEEHEAARTAHAHMTDVQVALTREAYLSVLAIGQALRQEQGMAFSAPDALAAGKAAIDRMLDALAPYVCAAETNLRRIVIDGVAPEAIYSELSDAS